MMRFWKDMKKPAGGLTNDFKVIVGNPVTGGVNYADVDELLSVVPEDKLAELVVNLLINNPAVKAKVNGMIEDKINTWLGR